MATAAASTESNVTKAIVKHAPEDEDFVEKSAYTSHSSAKDFKSNPDENSSTEVSPNPLTEASLLSKIFFLWPYKLLELGMQRPLEDADLPEIQPVDSSAVNREHVEKIWKEECVQHPENPSLHRAILKDFIGSLWYVQPLICMATIAKVVQAVALGSLVESFDGGNDDGYLWASLLVGCAFVVLFEHHHVFFYTWRKGMQYRIAFVAAIYDKSTRLSSTVSGSSTSSGKIMNLASNDVERFLIASLFFFYLFWAPLQSLAILGVGWTLLGPAFCAGFALLVIVVVPLQYYLMKKFAKYRSRIAAITDRRVTLVSQTVYGARVMKMNGWEKQFQERIQKIREEEVAQIWRANRLKAWNEGLFFSANIVISIVVFVVHVFTGGTLTIRAVFAIFSLINIVQLEICKHVSLAVMGGSECYVSIQRIQAFLEHPEMKENTDCDSNFYERAQPESHPLAKETKVNELAISLADVTCHWDNTQSLREKSDPAESQSCSSLVVALSKATLEMRRNELTCIIGTVGSGKSALIQAIIGELPVSSGTLYKHYTSLAYAAQDPWIMDGSVRENILMGQEYDADWYDEVVKACGLIVDFSQFPSGDETVVGDRGVQCSGGQRARIGLARALYRDADVLVCDDPLSAVDAKVGRALFHDAILGLGVNRGKCVILATHQHQYIGDYRCVLMVDGGMEFIGSYADCVSSSDGKLTAHMPDESVGHERVSEIKKNPESIVGKKLGDELINENENIEDDGKEMNVKGLVSADTFKNYAIAMGGVWLGLGLLVYFAITQAVVLITIATLGRWAERPPDDQKSWDILSQVISLGAAVVFLALSRAMSSFFFTLKASQKLHDRMTASVLRAKIAFFDTNPMGRILNRFSADVGSNDDLLPQTLFDFFVIFFIVIGALVTSITVLPFTLLAIPPLTVYFLRVRKIFVTSTRELKRLEGVARSPIFAMLSESISGIATIRSNDAFSYFQDKFEKVHDHHTKAFFSFIASSRWLGFRMDGLMVLFMSLASYLAVLFDERGWFDVDPAVLGLTLTMLMQLSILFQWCIRQSAEVINLMVGVERVVAFGDLPSEADLVQSQDAVLNAQEWPHEGSIDVNELSVRYRPTLPLSLNKVSFSILPGHRVGVVGRTGSGKSTLVQALFRLLEAEEGVITVDGVDISKAGLHTLRTKISVIPQFPVLFSGCTVRENLDPFHKHSDEEIRTALRDVHMDQALHELQRGWNTMVSENGSNFSVGQRQLLCLARAILCKNKILVLDEPTANVDSRTDELLQEALQKSFKGSTILSVAHRLDTVIDYDRILVLGHGELLEYGSPAELLENTNGHFSSMVRDTGESMSKALKKKAQTKKL